MQYLTLIAAVWAFAAAPALCRAGVLAACCAHDGPSAPDSCCPSHEKQTANPPINSGDPPRECGSCADVCKGVAKPDESRHLTGLDAHAQPCDAPGVPNGAIGFEPALAAAFHGLFDSPRRLPFRASGLPLRI